ncbi:MAG: 4a-hydroxytetrahydrobiopterin dehydratase [Alcanivoracaceae bacterium]|nr:4a-hydroxytetrahydrobiopterin dehydratase [Alcanivoracaceae bacterium]
MSLSKETCTACRADAPRVSEDDVQALRQDIPEWKLVEEDGEEKLQRQFTFPDFGKALAFTNAVGDMAESLDHHPALLTEYGKVTVTWWTHKIGGLHRNDFICAARTDELYNH